MNPELLKQIRQLAGLSQKELAEKVSIHYSVISKIEAGSIQMKPALRQKIKSVLRSAGITEKDIKFLKERDGNSGTDTEQS